MSRNLGTLTLDLVARIDGFNRNMQTATQTVERSVNRMNSAVNTATGTLKHFLALSGTYFSVEGLLHAADGYTEIANKIRLVTDTTAEFKAAMASTFQIAQETRTSWADTAQVYQRFMQISDSLGLSQERVAKITGTVSKAIAISGTSAVSAQAALMQFGQALGSGVLRGEEFNSVAEQAPALMFALAEGLGVTTAQLRAMANDGKLTGDVLVKSLEKVKDSVDKDFLTAVPTLSSSFTALSDALKEFVGSNASGAMGELANGILLVAKNLNLIGSAGAAAVIGYITKATIESTAAGYAKVTQTLASIRADQVAVALRQRVAVAEYNAANAELARARAGIVAATTDAEMTAALAARTLAVERSAAASMELTAANYALSRSAGVATVATRGLVTMLMSPLGLALTAATVAFFYFQDSTKAADDSLSDLTDSIKDLTVKYKELNLAQVQVERGKLTEQMNEASSAIDKARFKFDTYIATQDALFKVSTKSSMALQELASKVSKGEISTQQAVLEASKFKDVTTEQIGKFAQFTQEVDKNNGIIAVNKERLSVLNVVSKNKIALTDEQNKQLSVQKTLTDNLTSSYTTHKTSMENVLGSSIEMSRANGNSAQSILYLENVLSKYQSGAISATDAAKIFAQSTYIPESQRDTITDTAKRTDNLKSELNSAESKLAKMNKQLAVGTTAAENQANAYDKVAQALKGVSKELDKVNADSIASIQENTFKSRLLAKGKFTQNQINALANVAKAIGYNPALMNTPEFKKAVKLAVSGANSEDKLDAAKNKAKKDNPAKEQARLVGSNKDKKGNQYPAIPINNIVYNHAAKYGYKKLEEQYGLPSGLLASISMAESRGNPNATSPVGAKGEFQFMPATAKRFGIAGQERNTEVAAVGAAKYLSFLLNEFGDINKAIAGYNAGEGNVRKYKGIPPFKQTQDYVKRVRGYLSFMNGGRDGDYSPNTLLGLNDKSNEDAQREAEQREKERQRQLEQDARDRQSLAEKYYTEEQRINAENEKNMAEINRLYVRGTKEYHDALVLENERYLKAYSEYEWKLGEKARAQKALIDNIREDIGNSTMQATNDYLDAAMKSSMSPEQYAKWSLQRDYNNQYSSLYGQYENRQNEINAKDERGNFRIDDETERNALLEQARQEHLAKIYTLEANHAAKVKELDKQVNDAKVQQTSAAFGLMTSAMSTFFGQQSIAYKMAANAEKGYALYQAWLNSKKAVLAAYADTPGSIWAKMGAAAKAAIDTGLMTAAIQAISPRGFSSGGYTGTGSKYTPAGIVHAGEIVWSQDDIKRWGGVDVVERMRKAKGYADGGIVGGKNYMTKVTNDKLMGGNNVSVNVVVNADGSSDVQANAQLGKQMGDAIKAAVLQTIVQEKRQGGLLAR